MGTAMCADLNDTAAAASRKRPRSAEDGVLALLSDRAPAERLLPGPYLHSGMFRELTIQAVSALSTELQEVVASWGSSDAAADRILQLLEDLQDFVVDYRVLQRTQIGKELGQLKRIAEQREEHDIAN